MHEILLLKVSRYSNGHKYPKQKQRAPNLTSFAQIDLQSWPKVLGTSQLFPVFLPLTSNRLDFMQNYVINPPLPSYQPPSFNVGVRTGNLFYSIFNIERGGGGEGVLWIKLTSLNVQVSQHF